MSGKKDLIVAIDLGGTYFRVMLANKDGRRVAHVRKETRAAAGPEAIEKRLVAAVREVLSGWPAARVAGVGVAAPGPIDPQTGVLHAPPNLPGWNEIPLRDRLQEWLGLPVWAGNDANLAALGEHRFGCGRGVDDLVYLTISTGIGGGIISRGELLLGSHGLAAEAGHIILEPNGPLCGCGQHGCLEALASGPAIGRRAVDAITAGESSTLQVVLGNGAGLTAHQVVDAARAGDRLAGDVLRQAAIYVGMGIATLVHLLDPALVVIGGGVSNAGDLLLDPIRQTVRERTMEAYHGGVTIVPTALGDDVGLWGAIALVMDRVAV
ncbi:MAG: ROK family protein [Chloroflexi bacterium]|nr:ROK family protein [Chloroflexota bacterium]